MLQPSGPETHTHICIYISAQCEKLSQAVKRGVAQVISHITFSLLLLLGLLVLLGNQCWLLGERLPD